MSAPTLINPTVAKQLAAIEVAKKRGTLPSAREVFVFLRPKVLASRPIVGQTVATFHANGTVTESRPIYGKPTFRNVIDPQTGDLV